MTTLNKMLQFISKLQNKNKFFKWLSNNKTFINKWIAIKYWLSGINNKKLDLLPDGKPGGKTFFAQNAERVAAILSKLADERSKQVYTSIIEYRKTLDSKSYSLDLYEGLPYFIKEVACGKDEVFIDCGAYDGDTIDNFIKHCPNYKQIVAFEPETANFEQLKTKYKNNPKITLIDAGAWHKEEIVSFSGADVFGTILAGGGGDLPYTFRSNQEISISTKSIDSLELDKVTFIKMDIEGAEMNALKGASKTILRDKPKLAICIYHSNEDMLDIPEYIHSLVPEYKFYVRQHHIYPWWETVLYAL